MDLQEYADLLHMDLFGLHQREWQLQRILQEVEKQKAELERFKTEQQQKVALAKAESEAAKEQAAKQRVLADAQAYEIEKINDAIGNNPNYVKLQALEALKAISKDPASKIYFMDGNSQSPIPLMNIGNDK
jgi:regulator of protease activity HflC (stomatin/prohibitin superfamily)